MMNIYTTTSSVVNGKVELLTVKVPSHSCLCDECQELDRLDEACLDNAFKYLNKELPYDDFHDKALLAVGRSGPVGSALWRAYGERTVSLWDLIEDLIFDCETIRDEKGYIELGPFRENDFRIALEALCKGYQVRQRTVFKWKTVEKQQV